MGKKISNKMFQVELLKIAFCSQKLTIKLLQIISAITLSYYEFNTIITYENFTFENIKVLKT